MPLSPATVEEVRALDELVGGHSRSRSSMPCRRGKSSTPSASYFGKFSPRPAGDAELPSDRGQFDLVLCRNVGIYFSPDNRARLHASIRRHLRPGAVLLLSRTETLGANPAPYARREHRGVVYYELPA